MNRVDITGGLATPAAVLPAVTEEEVVPAQQPAAAVAVVSVETKKPTKGPAKAPKLPPPAVAPPAAPQHQCAAPAEEVPAYAPPPPPPLPSLPPPPLPPLPHYIPASVATGPHLLYGLEEVEEEEEDEDEDERPEGLLLAPSSAPIEEDYVEVGGDGSDAAGPVYMSGDTQN
jgi:hypothetical protein